MTTLPHVRWIGGAPGAGKSTIARRLATEHHLQLYATDDVMKAHADRTTPEQSPMLAAFLDMSMDERWLTRPPRTMLDTFHWYRGEAFDPIIEDLTADDPATAPPVIAEGFRLLPDLVKPLLADPAHAVWLLPTPQFREAAFASRGSTWLIAGKTSDPPRALANLLERDHLFTDRIRADCARLGLTAIDVDVTTTEDDLTATVTRHLLTVA